MNEKVRSSQPYWAKMVLKVTVPMTVMEGGVSVQVMELTVR